MKKHFIWCKWCGEPTVKKGARECDRCWELRWRIEDDTVLARDILNRLEGREREDDQG